MYKGTYPDFYTYNTVFDFFIVVLYPLTYHLQVTLEKFLVME